MEQNSTTDTHKIRKFFAELFSEKFLNKITYGFLYLFFIISCLLPAFTNFCVFIGEKSIKHENYGLAQICMSTACNIRNFMLRFWDNNGCIEYELSKLKKKNESEESMRLLKQAADHGCTDAAWQMARFHFDQDEKFNGYYYLVKTLGSNQNADLETAAFYVIFGNESERRHGWKIIEKIKANSKDKTIQTKAATALFYKKVFDDIKFKKNNWKDFIKANQYKEFFGYPLSDKKSILSIGIFFLNTHLKFNDYNKYFPLWKNFHKLSVGYFNARAFMTTKLTNIQPVTYDNLRIEPSVRYDQQVKIFDINTLLNKDMPWREWGIEWLKLANEAGVKEANKVLKAFTDAEKFENAAKKEKAISLDDIARFSEGTLK